MNPMPLIMVIIAALLVYNGHLFWAIIPVLLAITSYMVGD